MINLKKVEIIRLLRKIYRPAIIVLLAILFFLGTSSVNYFSQTDGFVKWLSPDETANYNFAKLYGQEGRLSIYEDYNLYTQGIMHPRSFRSDSGEMKPVSFLGIILVYGQIIALVGYKFLPYITPLFGAIGLFYYYLLMKRIFGEANAFISTALLATFPVFTYYSARSMFHNIPFISFLIIGTYYAVLAGQRQKDNAEQKFYTLDLLSIKWRCRMLFPALSGFFVGLSIITRTSELLWLGPVIFIVWLFNIRRAGVIKLAMFIAGLLMAVLPALYWNQVLYGAPIATGYPEMNQSMVGIAQTSGEIVKSAISGQAKQPTLFEKLKSTIFHFGFHPKDSLKVFRNYFVYMFPWLFWSSTFGLILFLQGWRKWRVKHFVYLLCLSLLTLVLVFYYGSWDFHDNPDASSFTIGNSYTRYWLPIYLTWLPFASLFIMKITKVIHPLVAKASNAAMADNIFSAFWLDTKKFFGNLDKSLFAGLLRLVIVFLICVSSVRFVIFGSEEGLIYQVRQQQANKRDFDRVISLTEKNSTIITRYHDKLFFPDRKVIVGLFDDNNMIRQYANLLRYLPVYYYNFTLKPADINYLNSAKLQPFGMSIRPVAKISREFSLYKLEKK